MKSPSTEVSTSVLPRAAASAISSGMSSHRNWPPLSMRSPSPLIVGLDAPADAVARFEQDEVDAGCLQLKRRRQAGEAGADDDDSVLSVRSFNSRP